MFLAAVALSQLLDVCAPGAGRHTMAAIVRVESGGNPLSIHDNDLNRTFEPHDVNQGVVWANQLIALHHSVDLGLSQINVFNLSRLGLTVRDAFDPCLNLRGGATILASDYRAAAQEFGPGQYALRRAIGAYNSGSLYAGSTYIQRILEAAGLEAEANYPIPDLQIVPQPLTASQLRPAARPVSRAARIAPREQPAAANSSGGDNPFSAPLLVAAPPAPGPASASSTNARASNAPGTALAPANGPATPIVLRLSNQNPQGSPILAPMPAPSPTPVSAPAAKPGASASASPASQATAH